MKNKTYCKCDDCIIPGRYCYECNEPLKKRYAKSLSVREEKYWDEIIKKSQIPIASATLNKKRPVVWLVPFIRSIRPTSTRC